MTRSWVSWGWCKAVLLLGAARGLELVQHRQKLSPCCSLLSGLLLTMFNIHQGPYRAFTPNLLQSMPALHQHQARSLVGFWEEPFWDKLVFIGPVFPPPCSSRASSIKFHQNPQHLEIFLKH